MAMTVLFALATAFVLSLTLVPALASAVLGRGDAPHTSRFIEALRSAYSPLLARGLAWPKLVAGVALSAFALSAFVGSSMGREFLPKLDEGTLVAAMVRLPSVSLEQSTAQARQVERTLLTFPEVTSVVCRTGRAEIAVDPMGINMSDVYVMLKPRAEWTSAKTREELVDVFERALSDNVPGAAFAFTQPIEMNTNDLLAGISSDLAIHVYGTDLVELRKNADHIVRTLRGVPGAKDVRAEQVAGMSTLTITTNRLAAARVGIDARAVMDTVAAVGGVEVGEIIDGASRYPIRVRLAADARKSAETMASVPVRDPHGFLVPLGQLASISEAPSPSQIAREGLHRRMTVQLNVRGRDVGSFVADAKVALERDIKLPTGMFTAWAGEYERVRAAAQQLAVVIPVALALIFVLLIMTFGEIRPALVIFVNVPMAVSGGVAALASRGFSLSVSAAVGFVALFGVAVLNGLVLVSSIERLRRDGASLADAIRRGAELRLRPVVTTALVASLGFVPMAIGNGAGAEVQKPLATVVIGGLLSSTLVTLFVLPVVYAWIVGERRPKPG
jgi:cobalt-zinc-cadmium resistance protein CzcA